jgi:hypothetical protein
MHIKPAGKSCSDIGWVACSQWPYGLGALLSSLPVDVNVGKLLVLASLFRLTAGGNTRPFLRST